jgi:hypothetical protein
MHTYTKYVVYKQTTENVLLLHQTVMSDQFKMRKCFYFTFTSFSGSLYLHRSTFLADLHNLPFLWRIPFKYACKSVCWPQISLALYLRKSFLVKFLFHFWRIISQDYLSRMVGFSLCLSLSLPPSLYFKNFTLLFFLAWFLKETWDFNSYF